MSGSLNRVSLIGNLGNDPEIRSLQNGGKVVSFSLATNESWTDRSSGERRERVEWHRISIFNPGLAKLAEQYLQKGSKVMIEGQLRTNKYTDREGIERYSTEVVLSAYNGLLTFLDSKRNDGEGAAPRGQGTAQRAPAHQGAGDLDDVVPF